MAWRRVKRDNPVLIGALVLGLMLQALGSAWHATLMTALEGLAGPAGVETVIICTADGFRRIAVDADGMPIDEPNGVPTTEQCFVCASFAAKQFAALVALPVQPEPYFAVAEADFPSLSSDYRIRLLITGLGNRGPPPTA